MTGSASSRRPRFSSLCLRGWKHKDETSKDSREIAYQLDGGLVLLTMLWLAMAGLFLVPLALGCARIRETRFPLGSWMLVAVLAPVTVASYLVAASLGSVAVIAYVTFDTFLGWLAHVFLLTAHPVASRR